MSKTDFQIYLKQYRDLYGSELITNKSFNKKNLNNGVVFSTYGSKSSSIIFIGHNLQLGKPNEDSIKNLFIKILSSVDLNLNNVFIMDFSITDGTEIETNLNKQLKYIKPKLIISIGKIISNALLKQKKDISEIRNIIYSYKGIDHLVTHHPKDLLSTPKLKRETWEDFKLIRGKYLK